MARHPNRTGLGRGLSSLLSDASLGSGRDSTGQPRSPQTLPIERLRPNPAQPRRHFDEQDLAELTASIAEKGVIQPLIVRPDPEKIDHYQIVAGERRWRAAQRAQLHSLPVLVRDLDDTEVLEIAIIENIQRADLNPVEEAQGYRALIERFGHTQDQLAKALGKSRSHIANLMRLLSLPDDVIEHLQAGRLSAGHARTLITADNPSVLAAQIIKGNLSVREAEALARKGAEPQTRRPRNNARPAKDADTRAIEADLTAHLRLKVNIEHKQGGSAGELRISYRTLDELDGLCQLLSR